MFGEGPGFVSLEKLLECLHRVSISVSRLLC